MTTEAKATPKERLVIDCWNGIQKAEGNLLYAKIARDFARILFHLADAIVRDLPEDRWSDEEKLNLHPDLRDIFLTGFALGYQTRAEEKKRK